MNTILRRTAQLVVGSMLCIVAAAGALAQNYVATLTGAQETPPTGSAFAGTATLTLSGTSITCNVVTNIPAANITASHIHEAPVGVPGPIIVPLVVVGQGATCPGGATLTASQITSLNTGSLYFNVHTLAFPTGEIRGLITAAAAPGATSVPTLGAWALLLLALILGTVTAARLVRRR